MARGRGPLGNRRTCVFVHSSQQGVSEGYQGCPRTLALIFPPAGCPVPLFECSTARNYVYFIGFFGSPLAVGYVCNWGSSCCIPQQSSVGVATTWMLKRMLVNFSWGAFVLLGQVGNPELTGLKISLLYSESVPLSSLPKNSANYTEDPPRM